MSLELLNAVKHHTIAHRPQETLKLRIGIHTGIEFTLLILFLFELNRINKVHERLEKCI